MSTDWDKELAKIDKQLASISDEELMKANAPAPVAPGAKKGVAPAAAPPPAAVTGVGRPPRKWALYLRLGLALALAVGILFWPHAEYSIACGVNLFLYLGASALIAGAGMWSAVWSWRHRAGAAHVLSLAIMMWGLVVGASEVLPRVGYAKTPGDAPPTWLCE
jgi:hypothetical protein